MGPFQKSKEIKNNEMKRQHKPYNKSEELKEKNIKSKEPKNIIPLRISSLSNGGNLTTSELLSTNPQKILVDKTFIISLDKIYTKLLNSP